MQHKENQTNKLHSMRLFVPNKQQTVCVLHTENNRSQFQELLSTHASGLIKAALRPVIPDVLSNSGQRESIWGLASLVMNYSTSMFPWVPVVSSVETESRGFDWQSLWSHNSHAVYDQRLLEGGKTRALLTFSSTDFSHVYSFQLFVSISHSLP